MVLTGFQSFSCELLHLPSPKSLTNCVFNPSGYLDQSYPSIHNSRSYLEPSSRPRGHHRHSSHPTPTSPQPKQNGSIFFTSPPQPSSTLLHPSRSEVQNQSGHQTGSGSAFRQGVLRSLALLSVLSLLLALNSLIFLLKIVWPLNMSGKMSP